MRAIEMRIDIGAPAASVWIVLTDFAAYAIWNPFIISIEGRLEIGSRLRVRIQPPGKSAMTFRPRIVRLAPPRDLRWLGHLFVPGLFDGEHGFRLEDRGRACQFEQSERFSGVLVPLLGSVIDTTRRGFEAMNAALKARVEASASRELSV